MQKFKMETTVGIFVVCGLLAVGYMTVNLGHFSLLGDDSYSLAAPFTSVSGLRGGSPVIMLGMEIGKVQKLTMDQKNQMVRVEIRVKNGIQVYDDAIATIKTEGLIGDKYLSISPGGGGTLLEPGGIITQTQPPADFLDLLGKYIFGAAEKEAEAPTNSQEVKK
jgi:phospholipid/cholesterol/gamma-HCH transport system substrate-binding protein